MEIPENVSFPGKTGNEVPFPGISGIPKKYFYRQLQTNSIFFRIILIGDKEGISKSGEANYLITYTTALIQSPGFNIAFQYTPIITVSGCVPVKANLQL